jgi:hypothetical protein
MKHLKALLMVTALAVAGTATNALAYPTSLSSTPTTLDFSDVPWTSSSPNPSIPDGYGGLDWTGFIYNPQFATVSISSSAIDGSFAGMSASGTDPFNFLGLKVGHHSGGLPQTVTITGWKAGDTTTPTYSDTLTFDTHQESFNKSYGWSSVTKIGFSVVGARSAAIDDLKVSVPEPVSFGVMLLAGLGVVFAARRRHAGRAV